MGFNRRKMEDQRRDAAEKEAASGVASCCLCRVHVAWSCGELLEMSGNKGEQTATRRDTELRGEWS